MTLLISNDVRDRAFADWLNIVDARVGYDERRAIAAITAWRACFDSGLSVNAAICKLRFSAAASVALNALDLALQRLELSDYDGDEAEAIAAVSVAIAQIKPFAGQ